MQTTGFSGLRARLLLLLALMIIPVAALILYNADQVRQLETRHMQAVALRLARLVELEQAEFIAGARQLLPGLAQLSSVRNPQGGEDCHQALAALLEQYPYYANFGVSGRDGRMRCSGLPMGTPVSIADRDYFRVAMANGDFAIGGYQIGRITGKSGINLGYPLRDARGRVDGVIFAALDLAWVSRKLAEVPLPEGTTITVLDGEGRVLARHPDSQRWLGKSLRDAPFARLILQRRAEGTAESVDATGVARLYAFTPLQHGDSDRVFVSVGIPRAVAHAQVEELYRQDLAALLLLVIAVTAVAWAGSRAFVLRPLNTLIRSSERLAKGDLNTRVGLGNRFGEFGQLGQVFDLMAAALQRRRDEAEAHERELRRINRALYTLSAGNRALVRAGDEASLLQAMCKVAVQTGGYRMAWVGRAEHDEQKSVQPVAQAGVDAAFLKGLGITWADSPGGAGPTGTAIRTGRPYVAQGLQSDPRYRPWHAKACERDIHSAMSLPLYVDQALWGAFTLYSDEPDAFDAAETELLSEMAEDLAYGLASLRTRARHEQAQATIQRLAYYDAQTGLPNHASLQARLEEHLGRESWVQRPFALLLVKLDHLREINDTLGFQAGNQVMQAAAQRIGEVMEEGTFVARMRGSEFAVLLPHGEAEQAGRTALDLLAALNEPYDVDDFPVVVRAGAGIVLVPEHGSEAEPLMRHADAALRLAKASGNGYAVYSPAQETDKKRQLALAADLHHALEGDELELYFQPKIAMQAGCICGFEALARWPHPVHGMVSPGEFIPLAERTGMIAALTDWALEAALQRLHAWREAGIRLPIAVNLSASTLQDPQLLDRIETLRAAWSSGEGMLELEVTESAIMTDPDAALDVLSRLRSLGIPLHIDDFGTGYSSLSYLKRLPVSAVKIDRSFVADMLDDAGSASIVRSTITLAHELGLKVVAEGVEDAPAWEDLRALGCDVAQGFYMGKPMPAEEVTAWLETSPWGGVDIPQDGHRNKLRG